VVKNLKKYLAFVPVGLFALLLGCGGGGGGGGGTNATGGGCAVSFTAGQTNAQPGDTIYGQIVDDQGCPLTNVNVRLYTAADVVSAIATTNADGYWTANVGTNVIKSDVDGDTLPNSVNKGFTYGSGVFQAATVSPSFDCKVPLPGITPGMLTAMTFQRFNFPRTSLPPLPPPTGCQ
jgi:hypothetical protein